MNININYQSTTDTVKVFNKNSYNSFINKLQGYINGLIDSNNFHRYSSIWYSTKDDLFCIARAGVVPNVANFNDYELVTDVYASTLEGKDDFKTNPKAFCQEKLSYNSYRDIFKN